MKILWFTNTACSASEMLGSNVVSGGWLSSLEKHLIQRDDISLAIAFYHDRPMASFLQNGVKYYPIQRMARNKVLRLWYRISKKIETSENVETFVKIINDHQPDVIHIHGTEKPFGLVQKYTEIPTVISIQGILTVINKFYFRGLSKYMAILNNSILNYIQGKGPITNQKLLTKMASLEKEILNHTKHVMGRTSWDKAVIGILAPKASYYHGDELLREVFYDKIWNPENLDKRLIFTICNTNWFKGLETIFEISILLKGMNINFSWNIAGIDGQALIVKACENKFRIKAHKVGINFMGNLTEKILATELESSSIYVQTSHIDNSPNSLCEAMLVGLPIIASMAGGTHSLFEHEKEGILIQDGDAHAFAGSILKLFNDKELSQNLSYNAKIRATSRHDPKKIIGDLMQVYYDLQTSKGQ